MNHIKSLSLSVFLVFFASSCYGNLILDADFENTNSASVWTSFGVANSDHPAPGIDSGVEGSETLKLEGAQPFFSGVFQDIAVDGVNIGVGNMVTLFGLGGHQSSDPIFGTNTAFLEIAFVDSAGMEFMGSTFTSLLLASSTPTDKYQTLVTGTATVPFTAAAVRVKAVFFQNSTSGAGTSGAAWFDNFELLVVTPEPGSVTLFAAGLVALVPRRKRSKNLES